MGEIDYLVFVEHGFHICLSRALTCEFQGLACGRHPSLALEDKTPYQRVHGTIERLQLMRDLVHPERIYRSDVDPW